MQSCSNNKRKLIQNCIGRCSKIATSMHTAKHEPSAMLYHQKMIVWKLSHYKSRRLQAA